MNKALLLFLLLLALPIVAVAEMSLYSDKDVFLGCLNCSKYDAKSVCNEYGTYGSKYGQESIWNQYGTYGNSYNPDSPWNPYSSTSPKIVGYGGKSSGKAADGSYFNFAFPRSLSELYKSSGKDLEKVRDALCK